MRSEAIRYLILPGWQGSSAEHWQSHWQRSLPNSTRVEQQDWANPQRADGVAELNRAVAADPRPAIRRASAKSEGGGVERSKKRRGTRCGGDV